MIPTQIQTETYLEVLTDRAPEEEMGVQTEALKDVPTAPLFVPAPVSSDDDSQRDGQIQSGRRRQCSASRVSLGKILSLTHSRARTLTLTKTFPNAAKCPVCA